MSCRNTRLPRHLSVATRQTVAIDIYNRQAGAYNIYRQEGFTYPDRDNSWIIDAYKVHLTAAGVNC